MNKIWNKMLIAASIAMTLMPLNALAHGSEAEHQNEVKLYSYIFYGSILFLLAVVFWFIFSRRKLTKWMLAISLVASVASGSLFAINRSSDGGAISLTHIHGLGYSKDGKNIFIPAHDGLKVYSEGKWRSENGAPHDYMGFNMVDNGFYTSGHPALGSELKNPFGVAKSTDNGKTLQFLDLYGEMDFHAMAVGYHSHVIYAFNPESNSRMQTPGLYVSKDDAKSWSKSEMSGFEGELTAVAAHPIDPAIVAVGGKSGLYVSRNSGQSFDQSISGVFTTAVAFSKDGEILVGGLKERPVIYVLDQDGKQTSTLSVPDLGEKDAISYIAQNPENQMELVFSTFEKDVYLSIDKGAHWTKIAAQGKTISQNR
ncbi:MULTISPECIES: F510_1955 family glycosylhydrolase [unclassified Paenibacillus]|uniref:F510_1955 family glycosylhydrolase n=1 Tax=unclassified Paenibacillus TaxID=185978 RepID=UPI001AEB611D|nr:MULTISPECIES: glycosyl hydrolase [unclassified Paenibacillus]MBP1156473.1 hypothetical protein [Paenibacillus sp. PvP091]MBP1168141.1 hypothetical protein [Paenibacillus sp. PvR098]MBP2439169.1 hypothetical protein [Paenibacillus sp. PvP052]